MPAPSLPIETPLAALVRRKERVAQARERVRSMFDAGIPGIQIAANYCELIEGVLQEFFRDALAAVDEPLRTPLEANLAVVAVGGTGRGELCPYSDVDLMFLDGGAPAGAVQKFTSTVVQYCWDSKLELGHSIRRLGECLALAKQDPEVATSLIESRRLWGSEALFHKFDRQFRRRVVAFRRSAFIEECLKARLDEGPQAQELEPDVKNSIGSLRDLHLLRWLGFAVAGARDLDGIRLQGLISMEEARSLRAAWEFLTRIRIDLHLSAGRAQDRLTRDEQLRIAEERGITGTEEQRPVERLMQEYFRHAALVAGLTRRMADRYRPRSLSLRLRDFLIGHRAEGVLRVSPEQIDARPRDLPKLTASLESILRMYKASALYGVRLSPRVRDAVKSAAANLPAEVSPQAAQLFMDVLKSTVTLGQLLRSLADTGVLDLLIPDFTRIRSLMQFNQYHHFTVDEHTLRTIEVVTSFEKQDTPVGAAYRSLKHKDLLHLTLLLHDIGKGFVTDHCIVGEEIALRIGQRLFLPRPQIEQLAFLVRFHLEMADVAFRRDISDEGQLVRFSHQVGSPERLRMLYVLTAADVTGVGPDVWTDWKADLLAELFDRCLLILSGKHYTYHEQERLQSVKRKVAELISPVDPAVDEQSWQRWIERSLQGFSAYYLTCTPPAQIAADLDVIRRLSPEEVQVSGTYDPQTGTVDYRVITRNPKAADGCFHRICGVLTAKRLEILSADINTTDDHVVVDTFRVVDTDFSGDVPPERIREVGDVMVQVLNRKESVETLLQRGRRFGSDQFLPAASNLPTRVAIDNESSETRTIVDVFAHDHPGLLYKITRVLHELKLSVDLAKISTHFDQVVDVFYVTENDGRKLSDGARIEQVRGMLLAALEPPQAAATSA